MKDSIRISQKHGINPSLMQCYVCLKDFGVALYGYLPGDVEAPRTVCGKDFVCPECQDWMKQGIILISVRDGESGENPYRTGKWCVVKENAVKRMIQPDELLQGVLLHRVAFIEDAVWNQLGLPE